MTAAQAQAPTPTPAPSAPGLQDIELGEDPPVVQGVPVAVAPERVGAPVQVVQAVHAGPPVRGFGAGWDVEPPEMIVLNYSAAISCFAMVDIITTFLNGLSLLNGLWWAVASLALLVGPICGLVGANRFNRCLVGVYLAFCVLKVLFQIAMTVILGMLSTWGFLWTGFIALIQFWVMKIVIAFWRALGAISVQRRRELAAASKEVPADMVYW